MKKTALTFGFISAAVSTMMMFATIPFIDTNHANKADILGYTSILLSVLIVFFGVRSYRENVGAGHLTFGRGFAVGILITLVSCACYIVAFETMYFKLEPTFGDKFAACMVERARVSGVNQQKIDETARQAQKFKQMYDNPALNAALTFAQAFPIGLIAAALSAGILRRKSPDEN